MELLVALLTLLGTASVCLYRRTTLFNTFLASTSALVVASIFAGFSLIAWLVLLSVSAFMMFDEWRQKTVSSKILSAFRKVLPPMSQTEKEALDAGTTWFEAELFQGKPDWEFLKKVEKSVLTAEEKAFLDGPVNELCA
ncbi:butyryl-CoA dehydrogenase [Vibrio ishigakensis]|uniref:Butyryl-CoA dehydrogenase n=1 Tax=Vibrio ishigakensis TaxID=1481914 RepID=A0A0B8Q3I5_9VIBR|nr:butyryl-CoA dehydrogenase [Vibrio ishigakensis]